LRVQKSNEEARRLGRKAQTDTVTLAFRDIAAFILKGIEKERLKCEESSQTLNEAQMMEEQLKGMMWFGKFEPGCDTRVYI
jgi:hypothetical protein